VRVLIVEDEPRIAADIRQGLERAGYVADVVADGEAAWFRAETETYDAMVLDLGLPRLDGLGVLRRLRAAEVALPVLILTARDGWRERVEGIDAGADDYLTKPFRMEELVARLRAILRRTAGHAAPVLRAGAVEVDLRAHKATLLGEPLQLTPKEFAILSILAKSAGSPVSAADLFEGAWHERFDDAAANTVMVHIRRLRKKLADIDASTAFVDTAWGVGYKLRGGPGADVYGA